MDLKKIALELSQIERKALNALKEKKVLSEELLASKAGISIDSARRAIEWLYSKELIDLKEQELEFLSLTEKGRTALEKGLPEIIFIKSLKSLNGKASIDELKKKSMLSNEEFNAALGLNKMKAFIYLSKENGVSFIELTSIVDEFLKGKTIEELLLELAKKNTEKRILNEEQLKAAELLLKRNLIVFERKKARSVLINKLGLKVLNILKDVGSKREFNLEEEVPKIFVGKKQPYIQFLQLIRRRLSELGFKEMYAPLIVQEFYNFDVLFQPQNHPARSWSDTYQLLKPKEGLLPERKKVAAIKAAHETGGVSASSGWQYSWLESIARRLMPTAHGTAHSARQLVKGVESPGKYFAIARCFRPDVMDATHLIEFNQTEGFIVGENLNFRHLLGTLKQFAFEIAGAKKVRFFPDYYPFTEPSVQLSAKHEKLGWIELGGAGMFRPEMLENLGIKGQAIAWGIGIDRLAMFKLGIKDIRYLFSQDIEWLRNSKMIIT